MPRRDDALVVSRFGAEAASKLLPAIKSLMDAFYLSDAKYTAADLGEMSRMATRSSGRNTLRSKMKSKGTGLFSLRLQILILFSGSRGK